MTTTDHSIVPTYYYYQLGVEKCDELVENRMLSAANGTGKIYELISPDGIHFWHCNTRLARKKHITVENTSPFFHLNFEVKNNSEYKRLDNGRTFASFGNYEYNLIYFPVQSSEIAWQPSERVESYELNLTPDFLLRYLPEDHPFARRIASITHHQSPFKISDQNLPITPHVMSILLDILNCPLERQYKRMFLKAKVIELLSVLLAQQEQFLEPEPNNGLRETDVHKMQQARELLHSNLQSPCSLIDLAHQVGTNENYLKKHFKILYGNTVYGYIHQLRMQQARQLIKDEVPLAEIANTVGYKNVHHFATAFKKFFGFSPYAIKA